MADVKNSNLCSNLDLRTVRCRVTEQPCGFSHDKKFRDCDQSAFVTSVTINGREFHVLLDRENRPTRGLVPVRTCRETTWHAAAGAYVNNVMSDGPKQSLLEIDRTTTDEVKLVCHQADVSLIWRNGEFAAE